MNAHRNKGFKTVSSEEFAGIIGDTATVQLLDVRTKEEYEEGHIAYALLVDFYSYNFEEQAAAKVMPSVISLQNFLLPFSRHHYAITASTNAGQSGPLSTLCRTRQEPQSLSH